MIQKNKDVAVVIICYKDRLLDSEKLSLKECLNVLGKRRDIYLILPEGVSEEEYKAVSDTTINKYILIREDRKYLESYLAYNDYCKHSKLYEYFKDYKYMLFYQTDCFVFRDNLDYFINMGYNYYGALTKWTDEEGYSDYYLTQNGGFCLRKVDYFINLCKGLTEDVLKEYKYQTEDVFFQTILGLDNVAPSNIAEQFSWEYELEEHMKNNDNNLPMGCHAFMKSADFWGNRFLFKTKLMLFEGSYTYSTIDNNEIIEKTKKDFAACEDIAMQIANQINAEITVYTNVAKDIEENGIKFKDWRKFKKDSTKEFYNIIITNGKLYDYIVNANYEQLFLVQNTPVFLGKKEDLDYVDRIYATEEGFESLGIDNNNKVIKIIVENDGQ